MEVTAQFIKRNWFVVKCYTHDVQLRPVESLMLGCRIASEASLARGRNAGESLAKKADEESNFRPLVSFYGYLRLDPSLATRVRPFASEASTAEQSSAFLSPPHQPILK